PPTATTIIPLLSRPPRPTLFPYTTLFRSGAHGVFGIFSNLMQASRWVHASPAFVGFDVGNPARAGRSECFRAIEESAAYVARGQDRKSTRLNSSHLGISYAVFCLKKKTTQ